jgi:hypothetical protein
MTTLALLWTAQALTAPAVSRNPSGRRTNWVSRTRMRATPASSATRPSLPSGHSRTETNEPSTLTAFFGFGRTKINSFDPPLTAVCAAYPTPPFLAFFHPKAPECKTLQGFRLSPRLSR